LPTLGKPTIPIVRATGKAYCLILNVWPWNS
jgi:hypothetical protein